jgi:hypothetical protein
VFRIAVALVEDLACGHAKLHALLGDQALQPVHGHLQFFLVLSCYHSMANFGFRELLYYLHALYRLVDIMNLNDEK